MNKRTWVVHARAECTVCGKTWTHYRNAQANAAKHAYATGHHVVGDVGLAFEYGGGSGTAAPPEKKT